MPVLMVMTRVDVRGLDGVHPGIRGALPTGSLPPASIVRARAATTPADDGWRGDAPDLVRPDRERMCPTSPSGAPTGQGRGIVVSHSRKLPANQRVEAAVAPCRTRTVVTEWLAAGERIVAFARPGKSLEMPF